MNKIPRIIIAGTSSDVGKTTVATSIMAGLTAKGLKVQPFKVGPDYIDPGFHSSVTGRISRNLDHHLMDGETLLEIFEHACVGADIAVIEGVMGLFDGAAVGGGSTADVARLLGAPVILVLDTSGVGQSIAAQVQGYRDFDKTIDQVAVILNKVGSKRHEEILTDSLKKIDMDIVGAIERSDKFVVAKRHLGLITAEEDDQLSEKIGRLTEMARNYIDLDSVVKRAANCRPLLMNKRLFNENLKKKVRIGIAKDKAFSFYYQDNLDILTHMGAELVEFSPLKDVALPKNLDGLYLGGGFPEIYGEQLSDNKQVMNDVNLEARTGMPIYAECGGLLYLSKEVTDLDGRVWPLCDALSISVKMNNKLQALGYRKAQVLSDNIMTKRDSVVVGHEFHYSSIDGTVPTKDRAYQVKEGSGRFDGFISRNVLASYIHLHFATDKTQAARFIDSCISFKEKLN